MPRTSTAVVPVVTALESARKRKAQDLTDRIRKGLTDVMEGLVEFADMRGWEPLGYTNFGEWAAGEMDWSRATAYRRLSQGGTLAKMLHALGLPSSYAPQLAPAITGADAAALARVSQETFDRAAEKIGPAAQTMAPGELARAMITETRPEVIRRPVPVAPRFTQLTLVLDELLADTSEAVPPSDREAVLALFEALRTKLDRWGMI